MIRQLQSVAPRMRAVWDRWLQLLVQAAARRLGGSRGVWRAMQALEVVYCTASLANLLGFLAGGQYRWVGVRSRRGKGAVWAMAQVCSVALHA